MSEVKSPKDTLKPEDITKNTTKLTPEQIALAVTNPTLNPHVLSVITRLNEAQMKAAFRVMNNDHIKTCIPKLQVRLVSLTIN